MFQNGFLLILNIFHEGDKNLIESVAENFLFSSVTISIQISIHPYRFYYPFPHLFYYCLIINKLNYFCRLTSRFLLKIISSFYRITDKFCFLRYNLSSNIFLNLCSKYFFDLLVYERKFVSALQTTFHMIICSF